MKITFFFFVDITITMKVKVLRISHCKLKSRHMMHLKSNFDIRNIFVEKVVRE